MGAVVEWMQDAAMHGIDSFLHRSGSDGQQTGQTQTAHATDTDD